MCICEISRYVLIIFMAAVFSYSYFASIRRSVASLSLGATAAQIYVAFLVRYFVAAVCIGLAFYLFRFDGWDALIIAVTFLATKHVMIRSVR